MNHIKNLFLDKNINTKYPHNKKIHAEQIKQMYMQLPAIFLGTNIGVILIALLYWDKVSHELVLRWLFFAVFIQGIYSFFLYKYYKKYANSSSKKISWDTLYIIHAFGMGCLWGTAGAMFFIKGSLEYQLLILLFIYISASAALLATAAYKPAFYLFIVPMVTPIMILMVLENDFVHYIISSATLTYLIVIIYFNSRINKMLMDSLRLRFENESLNKFSQEKYYQAEQANKAKSRFLASASHDLRQPIHAQNLFIGELQCTQQSPHAKKLINNLDTSIKVMSNMFNELLDISKYDAGVVHPILKTFSINTLLNNLSQEFQICANEKQITIRVAPCRLIVKSDPILLARMIRNLISNAIRYTESGHILIGCRRKKNTIRIDVIDTGIGIPENEKTKIFNEHYQIGNSHRDIKQGLGLGLSIALKISTLLSHPLSLHSTIDKGSRFSILVPLGTGIDRINNIDIVTKLITHDVAGLCILFIDDDETIRSGMRGLLMQWGCDVIDASTINEAIEKIENNKNKTINFIISDYRLANGVTGIQAIERIQSKLNNNIPSILITGDTAPDRLREATNSGYQLLHKPVPPAKLRTLIGNMLN